MARGRGSTDRAHTKATEGQYSLVRLKLARLVTSLLYGTRAMLVLNLPMTVSIETVRMAES